MKEEPVYDRDFKTPINNILYNPHSAWLIRLKGPRLFEALHWTACDLLKVSWPILVSPGASFIKHCWRNSLKVHVCSKIKHPPKDYQNNKNDDKKKCVWQLTQYLSVFVSLKSDVDCAVCYLPQKLHVGYYTRFILSLILFHVCWIPTITDNNLIFFLLVVVEL